MLSYEFFKKWYAAFAGSVDRHIMQEWVLGRGCMPWHIFTWGEVPCINGEKAIDKFLTFDENQKILLFNGFDYENAWVEEFDVIDKIALTNLMKEGNEVFIAAADFSWTFVWTHEGYLCGPYLCYRDKL